MSPTLALIARYFSNTVESIIEKKFWTPSLLRTSIILIMYATSYINKSIKVSNNLRISKWNIKKFTLSRISFFTNNPILFQTLEHYLTEKWAQFHLNLHDLHKVQKIRPGIWFCMEVGWICSESKHSLQKTSIQISYE